VGAQAVKPSVKRMVTVPATILLNIEDLD